MHALFVTGKTLSLDPETRIEVPEDRFGLSAIDCLDPDMVHFLSFCFIISFHFTLIRPHDIVNFT